MEQALALYVRLTLASRTALPDEPSEQEDPADLQPQPITQSSSLTSRDNALSGPKTSDASFEICGRRLLQSTRQLHAELAIMISSLESALPAPQQPATSQLPSTSVISTLDLPSPVTPDPQWVRHGHRITKYLSVVADFCGPPRGTTRVHFEWEELQRYDDRWEDELAYAELDFVPPDREAYLDSLMARCSAARPLVARPGNSPPNHPRLPRYLERGPKLSLWIPSAEFLAPRAAMGWYTEGIDHRYDKVNTITGYDIAAVEWDHESAACNC